MKEKSQAILCENLGHLNWREHTLYQIGKLNDLLKSIKIKQSHDVETEVRGE